jgi:hypothetical protein
MLGLSLRLLALCALCAFCAPIHSQAPARPETDAEAEAVKRAVETYLFTEEPDEKKSVIHREARIYGIGPDGKMQVKPFSKPARQPRGMKLARSPQRVVSVEVSGECATVKVLTDFAPDEPASGPAREAAKHYQYVWLLKIEGEWKIVAILMPHVTLRRPAPEPGTAPERNL